MVRFGAVSTPSGLAASHSLALVQKAAGHSSIRTTMGYVHLVDDDLSALVRPTSPTRVVDLKAAVAAR